MGQKGVRMRNVKRFRQEGKRPKPIATTPSLLAVRGCEKEEVENGHGQIFGKESLSVHSLMAPEFYCQDSFTILLIFFKKIATKILLITYFSSAWTMSLKDSFRTLVTLIFCLLYPVDYSHVERIGFIRTK